MLKLERLLKHDNFFSLKKIRRRIIAYFLDQHNSLLLKRKKLKLGAITFEIVEHLAPGTSFVLFETIDIRFINQDNTEEDERRFDARMARLKIKHLPLLILILIFFLLFSLVAFFFFSIDLFFNTPSFFSSNTSALKNLFKFSFSKIDDSSGFLSIINKTINSTFLEIFSFLLINTLKLI